ncbi:hypothetical protein C8A00DRAFT_17856 [Chaetomidium leptoderma]|uniref:Uncharacterized protein n=1 Tax=Chaetomidium leptoderma TaxID=669021 RepID=A0AAN6VFQ0_9PEZI|nr:hypothetical protein C8A00DRAFT_17856 [Chaetomidium leptoderma]
MTFQGACFYRRHLLENFCPRCFDHFDKPELLKKQMSPCQFHEEQEKQLRTRAKLNCSEEDKGVEMDKTIFPDKECPLAMYAPYNTN